MTQEVTPDAIAAAKAAVAEARDAATAIGQRLREALAVDEALGQAQAEESDQ